MDIVKVGAIALLATVTVSMPASAGKTTGKTTGNNQNRGAVISSTSVLSLDPAQVKEFLEPVGVSCGAPT